MRQQQGNLLPPDSGRRRYSLVMFVPAPIFLLLAAYLFWRGKNTMQGNCGQ